MSQMSPQVSELLEKALALSADERELIIDRLFESLEGGPAEDGVEAAWSSEIKHRVEEIQSGKIEMIPGEEVDRRLMARLSDARK
jgi:putative addiction module component (TIGR02574 family)